MYYYIGIDVDYLKKSYWHFVNSLNSVLIEIYSIDYISKFIRAIEDLSIKIIRMTIKLEFKF